MNRHAQTFDEADFDSLFTDQRTMEANDTLLSDHSFPLNHNYPDSAYPPYTIPADVLSMPSWQPSFAPPALLDTRNINPRLASEMSPQSAFSNGSFIGSQADLEEPASPTSTRTRRSRKKSIADVSLDGSPTSTRSKASKRKPSTAASLAGGGGGGEGEDPSRQALLERNRIAASKCRERKKFANAELEEKSRSMGAENAYLKATEVALRHELLELKYKCLEHSNCDCDEIREYMKRQALHQSPAASLVSYSPDGDIRRRSSTSISHAMTETPDTEIMSNSSNPMSPTIADGKKPNISGRSNSSRRL
jgi:hypothetical protein